MSSLRQKSRLVKQFTAAATGKDKDDSVTGRGPSRDKKGSFGGFGVGSVAALAGGKRRQAGEAPVATDLGVLLGSRARALAVFEQEEFSREEFVAEYFRVLSEKAVDNARQDLGALLSQCNEEVESVVYEHHQRFLEACKGVEDIEDQVALLRNYTNGLTALVVNLKGQKTLGKQVQQAGRIAQLPELPDLLPDEDESNSRVKLIESRLEVLLRELDMAVAVRDLATARSLLAAGQDCLAILDRDAGALSLEVDEFPSWRHHLESAVALRKRSLAAALERQLADAHASGPEIRSSTRALGQLLGDCHGVAAMLHCYSRKIAVHRGALLKQLAAGGADPDNLEYAGALVQTTLLEVARAADDLVTIFGDKQRDVASLFSEWVVGEARGCATALKRNALAAAAVGGLAAAVQVVSLALIFAHELEATHAVSVTAPMLQELWPSLDAALKHHLKRFQDDLRAVTAEEVDDLALQAVADIIKRVSPDGPPQVTLVTPSTLTDEIRTLAQLMAPLEGPKLVPTMRRIVKELFEGYVKVITATLKRHIEAAPANTRKLQPLVAPLMEEVAAIIEAGVPEALAPFTRAAGRAFDPKELDKALQAMYSECSAACKGTSAGARRGAAAAAAAAAAKG